MLDVRELERKWLRYKIRRYLPYGVLSLSLLLIVIVLANIDFSKESPLSVPNERTAQTKQKDISSPSNKKEKTPAITIAKADTSQTQSTQLPRQAQAATRTNTPAPAAVAPTSQKETAQYSESTKRSSSKVLKPSMDFLRKMKDNSVLPESQPVTVATTKQPYSSAQSSSIQSSSTVKEEENLEEKESVEQTKKTKVEIKISKTSKRDLQEIIKRFKKNNNPVLGVFIAKKYYEMGDYHKAYNYALITNQIDSTIEDSWIIFAKSLVKLGQKERAIKTLKAYINTSKSSKAQILLDNILRGKFK